MKIKVEISRPHYHPNKERDTSIFTKKRDLSVPPHWVANERVINPETKESFAVVMPPRDQELYEVRQPVHIHMPEYVDIIVNGQQMKAKVKIEKGYVFNPTVHFDHIESEELNIKSGDIAEL